MSDENRSASSALRFIGLSLALALAAGGGWFANSVFGTSSAHRSRSHEQDSPKSNAQSPCPNGGDPLFWVAPMDASYVRHGPGKSPMGMDLVPKCPASSRAEHGAKVAGEVRIDSELIQNMGVKTAAVGRRDMARSLRAVGRITVDERLVHHVHTKIHGWVEKLYVEYEGGMVGAGDPLLEIYSPELVSTQEELILAARYRDSTATSPYPDIRQSGEDLLAAARRRLELWDISQDFIEDILTTGEIRKTVTLYAPRQGVVTHLMVRHGMEVRSDKNLYTIADLSRVWVYAEVYEYELPWLEVGQTASVELQSQPGLSFEAVVSYIYPFLDAKTRTARVRLELENPDSIFKPNMFANVEVRTREHPNVLAIPEEAVIRSGRRAVVFVALGDGRFAPRDIRTGLESGDGWLEVLEGLKESERIVTSGQFLIDSESKLREAGQKLLAAEAL